MKNLQLQPALCGVDLCCWIQSSVCFLLYRQRISCSPYCYPCDLQININSLASSLPQLATSRHTIYICCVANGLYIITEAAEIVARCVKIAELLEPVRQAPLCTECDVTREPFRWFAHVAYSMTGGIEARSVCTQPVILICNDQLVGARGGAVGRGTALQAGRSLVRFPMVSLGFFIEIILPAALWPWVRLSL